MVMENGAPEPLEPTPNPPASSTEAAVGPQADDGKFHLVPSAPPSAKKLTALKERLQTDAIARTAPFRWKKGQSGNPSGAGRVPVAIRDVCRTYTVEVVAGMVNAMRSDPDSRVRMEARKWLADRGWGKAVVMIDVGNRDDKPLEFTFVIDSKREEQANGEA